MNIKILGIASALVAATALTSAAEAGNGVRLGFGFPLGQFTATPAHGGSTASESSGAYGQLAKKKASSQQIARGSSNGASTTVAKSETGVESGDTAETTTTGSTALVQTATAPATSEITSETKVETPAAVATTTTAAAEPVATETGTEEPNEDKSSSKVSELKKLGCKKFIPAVGLTVSIGCKD